MLFDKGNFASLKKVMLMKKSAFKRKKSSGNIALCFHKYGMLDHALVYDFELSLSQLNFQQVWRSSNETPYILQSFV